MCGIVGLFCYASSAAVDRDVLVRMRDTMVHRGPDGAGLWLSADGRVGLAFRRLAIIDLAENANQPMSNENGGLRVVFNGELYNHRQLPRELTARGHRLCTDHPD